MPRADRIDPQLGVIRTEATGVLTDHEILEHKRTLLDDPAFEPNMKELSDVRGVERLQVSPAGVRRFAAFDAEHAQQLGDYKMALVVSADVAFGMARMYQAFADEEMDSIGVFRDMREAASWLGIASVEE
jgi:hypothetical protein